MKRIVCLLGAFSIFAMGAFAQKLSITNQVGADSAGLANTDLYFFSNENLYSGDVKSISGWAIGDRLQLDFSSTIVTGRLRLEAEYNGTSEISNNIIFNPTGYVHFTPIRQIGFIVGNNVFKKYTIPASYLAAADDYSKAGRLITDTLSLDEEYYKVSDFFSIPNQILIGGLTSDWTFGKKDKIYLKMAATSNFHTDFQTTPLYTVDLGIDFGIKKAADFGFTAHDILSADRKFGAFAGLKRIDNFVLNGSYYYNFSGTDFSPEAAVEKDASSDNPYYEYKKQKTLHAVGISSGYFFKKIGLGIYADIITGLSDEYVANVKYYNTDGIQQAPGTYETYKQGTVTTGYQVVKRGSIVKYKDKKKDGNEQTKTTTDGFTPGAVPFYAQVRLVYDLTDNLSTSFNFKIRSMFHDPDTTWLTFYPRVELDLPSNAGDITAGVRIDMNFTRFNGISNFSVPVAYTYKFTKDYSRKSNRNIR